MRIAFTGTHKVGKTTLAEELADELPGYEFYNEPYLQLLEKGYPFSEIPTADEFIDQFNYSIKQIEQAGENAIFDRCPLDILAYIYAVDKDIVTQQFYGKMMNALSQIDLLVFVPVEMPDVMICQPSELPGLRADVNDFLLMWMEDLSNNEIITVQGTVANRKKQILDCICN